MAAWDRPPSTGAPSGFVQRSTFDIPLPRNRETVEPPLEGLRLGPLSFLYTHQSFREALGYLMVILIYLAWLLHPVVTALVDVLTTAIRADDYLQSCRVKL